MTDWGVKVSELDVVAVAAMQTLRQRGKSVHWIGFQKYMVDGERIALKRLLEMAKEQP